MEGGFLKAFKNKQSILVGRLVLSHGCALPDL